MLMSAILNIVQGYNIFIQSGTSEKTCKALYEFHAISIYAWAMEIDITSARSRNPRIRP
jgi:hypothetical protein